MACAAAPTLQDPTRSGVYGYLRLVPHAGTAAPATAGAPSGAYADRRYADADLVDYSKPGFAVVYLDRGAGRGAQELRIAIRAGASGVELVPGDGAIAVGGTLRIENRDAEPRVVTVPGAGVLRAIAPGDALDVPAREPGLLEVFVPDAPAAAARVFVAPGPFAPVRESGRFELLEVAPGARQLRTWHPRFPPTERGVELAPGEVRRVDLEVGVGLAGEGGDDAR
jgi:hypothetical protein